MRKYYTLTSAIFVIIMLLQSSIAFAANPLFSENAQFDSRMRSSQASASVVRERFVNIDFSLLSASGDATSRSLGDEQAVSFNLFHDVQFDVYHEKTEIYNSGKTNIWHGRIENMEKGSVTIAITGKIAMGTIRTDDGALYQIRFAGKGVHSVQLVDESQLPPDGEPIPVDTPFAPTDASVAADDGSIVDVMIVYTPSARSAVGGTSAMTTLINLGISETNTGLSNSGATHRVNLVHTEEVSYTESGSFSTDLGRLRSTNDGYMDNVHTLRDTHKADVVSMFINSASYCGMGYVMTTLSSGFASSAFSVVYYSCATGYYSLAHEMGHNWGSMHDEGNSGYAGVNSYSFGWQSPTQAFRTIMAYNCSGGCTRVNYWSNPDKIYSSEAMGSSIGNVDEADNRSSLNSVALTVANWRTGGSSSTAAEISSPTDGSTLSGSSVAFTWNDAGADAYGLWVGTSSGAYDIYGTYATSGQTITGLPIDGSTVYVKLWSYISGTWYVSSETTYTAALEVAAEIQSPTDGSTLYGSSATFTWNDAGANVYGLWVGTSSGAYDIHGTYATSGQVVTGLPMDGSTVYVKLWSYINGTWYVSSETTYASAIPSAANIQSPISGSTLSGGSATFTWNDVGADFYGLWVGSSSGAYDIFGTYATSGQAVTGLPTDGSTVYVKLWSYIGGVWYVSSETTYTGGP